MAHTNRTDRRSAPIAACTLRVQPGAPVVRLIPAGIFDAPRGSMAGRGPWRLTAEAASRVIERNASRSADILIDYEHQALLAERNGLPAPAAGWIDPRSLRWVPDGDEPGLYGAVRWTPRAAEMIGADEYRYLSPVFPYDPDTGEVLDLAHVALVNVPAIDEPILAALSARLPAFAHHQETPEMLEKLLAALGLPETTSEADALAGVAALKAKADGADAQIAALKAAAPAAAPDPKKFVPIEAFEAERAERVRLAALSGQSEIKSLIDAALADGRLLEAQRTHAEALGRADLAALKAMIEAAAPVAALKGMQTAGHPPVGADGAPRTTDADLAVCRMLGLTAEEFAKGKLETR
ncbi:phage protease [Thauera aromatica]|uniref:phage protease n=1 Tax=Thauera aromatica TaxID=59405 RepID=UPI001FFC3250|nr:phage protease [Thauera aromatica]MCK2095634.1 phage protease [Thauera aromatica]